MTENDDFNSRTNLARTKITKHWIQHMAACSASLAALSAGTALGWPSLAGPKLVNHELDFPVSKAQNSLIGSLLTIGAAVSCFPAGCIIDKVGRKITLLGLVPVFLLGWGLLIWARSVEMIYAGRFILGLCVGATCVTVPVYIGEISQKEIRGSLGSYFQLFLSGGILFAYITGSVLDVCSFSIVCGVVPIIFCITFLFFPETPVYNFTKNNLEKATSSLHFFRGAEDYEIEMDELSKSLDEKKVTEEIVLDVFMSRQGAVSLAMSIALMIFQQLCGINALVFNATDIFQSADTALDPKYSTMIIGVMQVVGSLFVTILVENVGRVMLLVLSALFMALSTFFLGLYFFLKENSFEMSDFEWLPLVCFCVYIIMFSIGFGPVPWMLIPELIPSKIKGVATSIACVFNWLCAFLVTKFYFDADSYFGTGITFWIFTTVSVVAAYFVFSVLPETKGKSLEEIQRQL